MTVRPVFTVDSNGVKSSSLAENVETLNDRQRDAFGADLALTPATPQAQWSGIEGLALTEVGEQGGRAALYGSSVDHAPGVHLDAIGSLLEIERLQAQHSRVTATLTGVDGVNVPAGSRAKTSAGDEFETETSVLLKATGVMVAMRSLEAGPIEAAAGELNEIVTGVPGWESVTNAEAAVLGRLQQSDDEFRDMYRDVTAHRTLGPLDGLRASLIEAGANQVIVEHNPSSAAVEKQDWTVYAHGILVLVHGALAADIQRGIESHRGMGVATMTAIVGGDLPSGGIAALTSPYEFQWRGADYTIADADWTAATDNDARAEEVTDIIGGGVTVAWTGERFIAQYEWKPLDENAGFDDSDLATALGLDPDSATVSPGPFVRPIDRALSVSFTATRRAGFPGDGLNDLKRAVMAVVEGYPIGHEPWIGDFTSAAERVAGTRISLMTVQSDSADVSGVEPDLSVRWTLAEGDISITLA